MKHEALKLLVAHAVGTRAGATLKVYDAMPRDAAVFGKCVEGVANEAGVTGKTCEERDLAVGRDAASRDAPNDGEDQGVRGGRGRHGCVRAMPNRGISGERSESAACRVRRDGRGVAFAASNGKSRRRASVGIWPRSEGPPEMRHRR